MPSAITRSAVDYATEQSDLSSQALFRNLNGEVRAQSVENRLVCRIVVVNSKEALIRHDALLQLFG